jgi:hypothetical protein
MYPNGSVDPWSALGVRSSPDREAQPTLWILGASHHAWTHPSNPDDQLTVCIVLCATSWQWVVQGVSHSGLGPLVFIRQVVSARKAIWTQVIAWLEQE